MNVEQIKEKLKAIHQEQLLTYYDELDEEQKTQLLSQIEGTDFSVLSHIGEKNDTADNAQITPIKALTLPEIKEQEASIKNTGVQAIRSGKLGAVLLAGGMGTRLGSDSPKGMYDIGITKPVFIFQRLIENLLDVVKETETCIHLFIMTSDKNHEMTTAFLEEKEYFGYDKNFIHFFQQDMAPATDYEGKIYLEEKGKLASSPNGNGGWLTSMRNAGLLEFVHKEGIEWLNVFAVDNVLQRIADPLFLGAAIESGCTVGAKVVRKNDPDEKVGVMCLKNGHPSIMEYYDLTPELRDTLDENGERVYNFGVILNYLIEVKNAEQVMNQALPVHVVEKKIPYLDENGILVKPEKPNGYKFETLILDLIELMDQCLPFEVEREKEFAPIKNKTGVDSVESAPALLKKNGYTL
ncbi:MAG: UDPGP type 1 family protein [Lachnospiraceae bacterium]|nr:UDPGP type 1 family protein [Lachnospiraceae bacterium]